MSRRTAAILLVLAIGCLDDGVLAQAPAAATPARKLEWRPAAGQKLVRSFDLQQTLAMQSMRVELNGVEQISQRELTVASTLALRFEDTFGEIADGRPRTFERFHERLHFVVDLQGGDSSAAATVPEIEASTTLQLSTVRFTWVDEEKGYGRLYTGRESAEEFLTRLTPDADLQALLPGKPVAVGDSWDVPAARLVDVLAPVGALSWRFMRGGDERFSRTALSGIGGPLNELFGGNATGAAKLAVVAFDTTGGADLARVSLEVDLVLERDQRDWQRRMRSPSELIAERDFDSAVSTYALRAKGELVWDVAQGRARSLTLSGPAETGTKLAMTDSTGSIVARQELALAGGIKLTYAVRDAKEPEANAPPTAK